ncbi:MAG TPA: hypothetical protein ENK88_03590 [Campylobacterales bacterium]|nr:hypothetical protein [Campylobacterales bacterium]
MYNLAISITILLFSIGCNSSESNLKKTSSLSPIDITLFGAKPNDNIDDTKAIKKALEVSGNITMPRGLYNVKGLIRVGKTIIDGNGSTFKSKLDTSNGGRTAKNIMTLSGDKIEIKNLLLDGAYTNGNSKEGTNVSSLLHIYDSKNILLDRVDTVNHASNWWSSKKFNFSVLNNNHKMDMYHVIYIGFSDHIIIKNMEQRANIKTEGLLIYESDNIKIENFKSVNSPNIWTSLHIVASDNIKMNHIDIGDGKSNQGGSSVNFIANHHFNLKNIKTINKQGFDISNEIRVKGLTGRITRDTSFGVFEDCHFEGQRAFYGYPTLHKGEELIFRNTKFIPTKEGYETWGVRIQKAGSIKFENCIFGSSKFKTYGIIMGDSKEIIVQNCKFINPSTGIYIYGKKFGTVDIESNVFNGNKYSPVSFYWDKEGNLEEFRFKNNKIKGELINNKAYNITGKFKIKNNIL